MNASFYWTVGGLLAALAGVILLFRYGMPYRVRSGGADYIVTEQIHTEELASDRLWDVADIGAIMDEIAPKPGRPKTYRKKLSV